MEINDLDDLTEWCATQIHKLEMRVLVLEAQVTAMMDREFPPIPPAPKEEQKFD